MEKKGWRGRKVIMPRISCKYDRENNVLGNSEPKVVDAKVIHLEQKGMKKN